MSTGTDISTLYQEFTDALTEVFRGGTEFGMAEWRRQTKALGVSARRPPTLPAADALRPWGRT